MQTIPFEPAAAARIKTASGQELVLVEASAWNGLSELVDNRGRKLIVAFPGGRRGLMLDSLPSPALGDLAVIGGSPDLLAEIGLIEEK